MEFYLASMVIGIAGLATGLVLAPPSSDGFLGATGIGVASGMGTFGAVGVALTILISWEALPWTPSIGAVIAGLLGIGTGLGLYRFNSRNRLSEQEDPKAA